MGRYNNDHIKKYPLELVIWEDAESQLAWANEDEIKEFSKGKMFISEVGFIVHEDKECVIISSQITGDGDIGNRTRICLGWIQSRKRLK